MFVMMERAGGEVVMAMSESFLLVSFLRHKKR
jgi:hypothetical protein